MRKWLRDLDRILRGEATRPSALVDGSLPVPAVGLSVVILILGIFYGLCMGCYALITGRGGGYRQMLSSMGKVPALFFLTLLVTFPSLYVFNALVGSRLTITSVMRLLIAAMSVMLALLASFGTIVAFFSFTTTSYPLMVLLNVLVFGVSGFLGLTFLLRTLHRLTMATTEDEPPKPVLPVEPPPASPTSTPLAIKGALDRLEGERVGRDVKTVFRFWIIIFGLVGAQMSWILRPFIGGGRQFVLFRPRGSNFFQAVYEHIQHLFGH